MTGDPFAVLGLSPGFDLDRQAIERAYLRKAAALHPDAAGEASSEQAADLNRARAALADSERRAEALLRRLGGPEKERDKSLPTGFLMEIMEVREQVEAALAEADEPGRAHWRAWALDQRSEYERRISELFRAGPPPLTEIRKTLNAWRYVERLLEQLDPEYDPAKRDFE
ncbi:hypothetical protein PHYC_00425 [Phycisphaerales bacterium]|nr:hypothetical protein PHYC_00425 [Phycisphaerales bacterium]